MTTTDPPSMFVLVGDVAGLQLHREVGRPLEQIRSLPLWSTNCSM
jgi:hypothetical protein